MNDELGFEHLTKRQLVKFCKKFHKDCYRLIGQKMKLKDQLAQATKIIRELAQVEYNDYTNGDYSNELSKVLEQAEQFLKEAE